MIKEELLSIVKSSKRVVKWFFQKTFTGVAEYELWSPNIIFFRQLVDYIELDKSICKDNKAILAGLKSYLEDDIDGKLQEKAIVALYKKRDVFRDIIINKKNLYLLIRFKDYPRAGYPAGYTPEEWETMLDTVIENFRLYCYKELLDPMDLENIDKALGVFIKDMLLTLWD